MKHFIPAADFAIRTWSPEVRLAALITGNFDDSRSTGDVWTVAGYVGYSAQWDHFERLWTEALARHGVAKSSGPFAKGLPPEEHVEERAAFFKDLVAAIRKCGLYMVSSTVWLKDLERFNQETGVSLEAYPLAAHACLAMIGLRYEDLPVTTVFDRVEKVDSKLTTARSYLAGDSFIYPGLCDHIGTTWLPGPATSRDVPALQAADLVAWEVRKAHFGMKQWQSLRGDGHSDRWAQWHDFMDFTREQTGEDPKIRKSLDALISGDAKTMKSIVWDHMQLMLTHKVRRGIWIAGQDAAE
jgi:hypothetical protein